MSYQPIPQAKKTGPLGPTQRGSNIWGDSFWQDGMVSCIHTHVIAPPDKVVYSQGLGVYKNIVAKEHFPIVLAIGVWIKLWIHKHVEVFCDNICCFSQDSLCTLAQDRFKLFTLFRGFIRLPPDFLQYMFRTIVV